MRSLHQTTCAACGRLSREYAQVTTTHIELTGKHRIAKLQGYSEKVAAFETELEAAQQARDAAREAIRQHELSDHAVDDISDLP